MYIKKDDFNYLKTLYDGLDADTRKRFLKLISQTASDRHGEELLSKIKVVGEEIIGEKATESSDWITRTMIKKAYKEAKE